MRLCLATRQGSIGLVLDMLEAPPTVEVRQSCQSPFRVFERLTERTDPVDGIVFYEEVPRQ